MQLKDDVKKAKEAFDTFITKIGKHPTHEWLRLVARLDITGLDNLLKAPKHLRWLATKVQPFERLAIVDAAVRFSNNYRGQSPQISDYALAVEKYLESDYRSHELLYQAANRVPLSLFQAMTYVGYEQFISLGVPIHLVGRCEALYFEYNDDMVKATGLSGDEIFALGFALWAARSAATTKPDYSMKELTENNLAFMTERTVKAFLKYFCADYATYRSALESAGVKRLDRYGFKPLWRFPILQISQDCFCIPVKDVLLSAVTEGLFHVVLSSLDSPGERSDFLSKFGAKMEDYVTKLFQNSGAQPIPCDSLNIAGPRAEFYVEVEDTFLVVESKKFAYRRDTAISGPPEEVQHELRKLIEAFYQVENTFRHLPAGDKFGFIVVYGRVPIANSEELRQFLRDSAPADRPIEASGSVMIIPLDTLERLTAGSPFEMVAVARRFEAEPSSERGDLRNFIYYNFPDYPVQNRWLRIMADRVFSRVTGLADVGDEQ